ncbi:MAG TPA: helix-hairpin-helix domain-containing protein [Solirubrobacterales bacterium]|nr:helix-hairpin-helix domain-containing protein [Solirubrobacterales bacterium]
MSTRFKRFISTFLLIAALTGAAGPVAVSSADTTGLTGATGTEIPTDTSSTEAPLSMTPEQIAALQGATGVTGDSSADDDKSFFDKVSDFVTDNAPFIIIGIVVLAAILAGIFIMRGRSKDAKGPKAAAAGSPASVPSASEIRRRKRAAMQRSREEERLRRKAGLEGRQAMSPSTTLPLSANLPADPVEAEKQSARDQLQAAAAVARSGPVPAPVSPTQTAPAAGVIQSVHDEPDTAFTSPTPTPAELSAATAAAMANAPRETAVEPAPPEAAPAPAPVEPAEEGEYPTQVYDLPSDTDESPAEPEVAYEPETAPEPEVEHEPAIEAPGLDATVGEAAAAFAAGAAGGGLVAKAASGQGEDAEEESDSPDDAARDAEQRLKAKVAEIKAEQGRGIGAPVPPAPVPAAEPEPEPAIEERLDQAEQIQREIETAEEVPPTPTGLAAVEQRLQANSDERDRTLREAEERLARIEQRAEDAEKRAAFAERLAQLKIDESERERRLSEVITGIDRAEERAIEAEERAKAAEEVAAAALEESTQPPARPEPARPEPAAPAFTPPPVAETPAYTPPAEDPDEAPAPVARSPLFGGGLSGSKPSSGTLNLNSATFEELRDADLSVTQATRILAYRERFGGYRSVEDLEKVPGFPAELIESLRGRITV